METLPDLLKKLNPAIKIKDDKEFIISDKEIIYLKTLNHKSTSFAKKLIHIGVKSEDRVPILINNSPDFIISVLSLWMIEAIPVPINLKLLISEIEEQIRFLDCQYVLIDGSFKQKINIGDAKLIKLEIAFDSLMESELNFKFDEGRTAVIMFTSGSSGKPKAVELSFSNLIQSAKTGNEYLNQTAKDYWLASLPFYHIGGFSIIFRALILGAALIIPASLKIESIIESISKRKPTLVSLVSSQLNNLLDKNVQPKPEMRNVLLGGGFIDSTLIRKALNKGWKVSKVYGSTETSSFITVLSPDEFLQKPESVGKSIPPNEIFIYDKSNKAVSNNLEGEIVVKSPAVMKNYFNDVDTTNKKLRNDLYFTGDYGYKDSEGYLYVVNRRSDMIVTGGENVNPVEVEEMVMKFSKVKEVCVLGIDDAAWGQVIIAAIVPRLSNEFTLEELKNFLKDKIASFKIPKEIFFVNELPKTELGKVRRELVKEMFL